MAKSFSEAVMNPVRQRILTYLAVNRKGTAKEIATELDDIPLASLYRHINVLLEANCIECVNEEVRRGTVLKTYALVTSPSSLANENVPSVVEGTLMNIATSFSKYFAQKDIQPEKDLLTVSTSTLVLDDNEMMDFLKDIGTIMQKYLNRKMEGERKNRSIVFISAPVDNKGE